MIIRSALDIADHDVSHQRNPVFAWLCAARAAEVCSLGEGRIGGLVQEALVGMGSWCGVSEETPSLAYLRGLDEAVLDQLDADIDFGQFDAFLTHAISCVGHALASVLSVDDQSTAAHESRQAAQAEVSIVKGAYYRKLGSYDSVYRHRSFTRQIKWQSDDLKALGLGVTVEFGDLLARASERGAMLADDIRNDQLI